MDCAIENYGIGIEKGLDHEVDEVVDKTSQFAHEILQQTLLEGRDRWTLARYLANLQRRESGFTYKIARDGSGMPVGVVWMTPTMRSAFERYGWVVCLDAMKRQLYSLKWPYVGPVVLDENRSICVVAEAFVNSERLDMYERSILKWHQEVQRVA
ncbi:MAG: hypothetical protein ACREOZ_02905 [Gloeomargaritales cyanobacterium]